MPVYTKDGGMRFVAGDHELGSAQRAIADAVGGTVAPVAALAAPTLQQMLDASETPAIRKYCEKLESAWRDPPPIWPGGNK